MQRRVLFALLFGSGIASAHLESSGETVKIKPLNGTCPVCGTKAPPIDGDGKPCNISPPPECMTGKGIIITRLIRCSFCSAAFFQHSEW